MSTGSFDLPPRESRSALNWAYSEFLDKLFADVAVIDIPLKSARFQKMFYARLDAAREAAKKWATVRAAR